MKIETNWRFIVNSNKKEIAERFLEKIKSEFEGIDALNEFDIYWKDKNTHVISLRKDIDALNYPERLLSYAAKISRTWKISISENEIKIHDGVCSEHFNIPELSWAHFSCEEPS